MLTPPGGVYILGYMSNKTREVSQSTPDLRRRIHMVQGQLDGVVRMLEEEQGCVEVLTQFKAARAGLDRALSLFLQENLQKCIGARAVSGEKKEEIEKIITELVK